MWLWCVPQIAKFPRIHRFTVGDRMEEKLLDLLDDLLEAKYTRDKLALLGRANIKLEQFRFLARGAKDLHFFNIPRYEYLAERVTEIGRLIGGWIRQQKGTGPG